MGCKKKWFGIAIALTLVAFLGIQAPCFGIIRDIEVDQTFTGPFNDWIDEAEWPDQFHIPSTALPIRIKTISGSIIPAAAIGDQYIITAAHWRGEVFSPSSTTVGQLMGWLNASVWVDKQDGEWLTSPFVVDAVYDWRTNRPIYTSAARPAGVPAASTSQNIELTGPDDVVVLRIADRDGGSDVLQDWASIAYDDSSGERIALGGYGPHRRRFIRNGEVLDAHDPLAKFYSGRGELAWGLNRIDGDGLAFDAPFESTYEDYETGLGDSDSGTPWFRREGLNWSVYGTTQSPTGVGAILGDATNRAWIDQAVAKMRDYHNPTTGLVAPAIPAADTTWLPTSGTAWNTTANWDSGVVPTNTDLVKVQGATGASIDATGATARNLVVGWDAGGQVTQNYGGAVEVKESIILGYQDTGSEWASYSIFNQNSTLDTQMLYVGYEGQGSFLLSAGTVNVDETTYVGRGEEGSGAFVMFFDSATLNTRKLVVGAFGKGEFIHNYGGTVNAQSVQIGANSVIDTAHPARTGVYNLGGIGILNAGNIQIGKNGTGNMQVSGGTANVDGAIEIGPTGSLVQSAGTVTSVLTLDVGGTYYLLGGTFHNRGLLSENDAGAKGAIEFANGTSWDAVGIVDFRDVDLVNANQASFELKNGGLAIVPVGTDLNTVFGGNFTNNGTVVEDGQPVVIAANRNVEIYDTINRIDQLTNHGAITLHSGLLQFSGSGVNHGTMTSTPSNGIQVNVPFTNHGTMVNVASSHDFTNHGTVTGFYGTLFSRIMNYSGSIDNAYDESYNAVYDDNMLARGLYIEGGSVNLGEHAVLTGESTTPIDILGGTLSTGWLKLGWSQATTTVQDGGVNNVAHEIVLASTYQNVPSISPLRIYEGVGSDVEKVASATYQMKNGSINTPIFSIGTNDPNHAGTTGLLEWSGGTIAAGNVKLAGTGTIEVTHANALLDTTLELTGGRIHVNKGSLTLDGTINATEQQSTITVTGATGVTPAKLALDPTASVTGADTLLDLAVDFDEADPDTTAKNAELGLLGDDSVLASLTVGLQSPASDTAGHLTVKLINDLTVGTLDMLAGGVIDPNGYTLKFDYANDGVNPPTFKTFYPADINLDGEVSLADMGILGANFDEDIFGRTWAQGDLNGDRKVGLLDLNILGAYMGSGGGSAPTPEPASLALLALGGLALCGRRR